MMVQITEEDIKRVDTENLNKITRYDVGVDKETKKFVIISWTNANKDIILQQKLTDKEARMFARELNNARSHLKRF